MTLISRTGSKLSPTKCAPRVLVGRGFSLVELLVVLTIMSVLVSSISYVMLKKQDTLKTLTTNIVHNLHIVQQKAIRDEEQYQIQIDLGNNELTFLDESIELPANVSLTVKTAENQLLENDVVGMTFYPDASSSGGVITLETNKELFEISVIWISGKISMRHQAKSS